MDIKNSCRSEHNLLINQQEDIKHEIKDSRRGAYHTSFWNV